MKTSPSHKIILALSVLAITFAVSPRLSGQTLAGLWAEYDQLTDECNRLETVRAQLQAECEHLDAAVQAAGNVVGWLAFITEDYFDYIEGKEQDEAIYNLIQEMGDAYFEYLMELEASAMQWENERIYEEIQDLEKEYDQLIEQYEDEYNFLLNYLLDPGGYSDGSNCPYISDAEMQEIHDAIMNECAEQLAQIMLAIEGKLLQIEFNNSRISDLSPADNPMEALSMATNTYNAAWQAYASVAQDFYENSQQWESVRLQREIIKMEIDRRTHD